MTVEQYWDVTESQSSLYPFLLDFAKTRTCRMILLLKVLHCGITTEGFPSTRITLLLHDTSVIGWDDGLVEREREREGSTVRDGGAGSL